MEAIQAIPENIQVAEYAAEDTQCTVIAIPVNFDNIEIVSEILPNEIIQVKKNKKCCIITSPNFTQLLIWLFMCILFIAFSLFIGYIVCVFLVLVFNVDWDIMSYSVDKQLGIYFGIGIILTIIGCIFINKDKNL